MFIQENNSGNMSFRFFVFRQTSFRQMESNRFSAQFFIVACRRANDSTTIVLQLEQKSRRKLKMVEGRGGYITIKQRFIILKQCTVQRPSVTLGHLSLPVNEPECKLVSRQSQNFNQPDI